MGKTCLICGKPLSHAEKNISEIELEEGTYICFDDLRYIALPGLKPRYLKFRKLVKRLKNA